MIKGRISLERNSIVLRCKYYLDLDSMGQNRYHFIIPDLLKGIAIIWIVVFHVYTDFNIVFCLGTHWLNDFVCRVIMHGALGVDIFVILSGYLLALSCLRKESVQWVPFLKKRFLRIAPLYWFAIISILFLESLIGDGGEIINMQSVLYHFLGIHGLTQYIFDLQGAWWFLTLILQLYLVFPVAWYISKKFRFSTVLISSLTLTILARFVPFANVDGNYSLFAFLPDFIIGIGMANKLPKLECTLSIKGALYCIVALLAFVAGIQQDTTIIFGYAYGLLRPFVSFGLFLAMCYVCNLFLLHHDMLVQPLSTYGKYSYAIYLFHRPLIYKWVTLTTPFLPPVLILPLFVIIMLPIGFVLETVTEKMTNYYMIGEK